MTAPVIPGKLLENLTTGFLMKNRERVKIVRDWQDALIQERHGRFLVFVVNAELFLIPFLLVLNALNPLMRMLNLSSSFMGVLAQMIVSIALGLAARGSCVSYILKSKTIKLIACTLLSLAWGYLVADIIKDEPFKANRVDQFIAAVISFVASLKIHYGAFSHLED